jgi:apolipoprotein N-acyltransferase
MGRRLPSVARVLALLVGGLPVLAFPEPSWWWFGYGCLIPLLAVIRAARDAREAALRGWLGGIGFILAVHHWLLPSLLVFLPVVAIVVGALWLPWGLATWHLLHPPVTPRRAAGALVVLPCAWLTVETIRSWAALGGPWGLLGASQWQVEPTRALAALGGVWLVSLAVVAVNTGLALLVLAGITPSARLVGVAGVGAVAAATLTWWAASPVPIAQATAQATARVAVVQPGLVRGADPRFDRGEALTRELAGQRLDLVIWGESGVGLDRTARPDVDQRLVELSRIVEAPLLVNVDARQPGRGIRKTALLVGPGGPVASYDKTRLVPFGEYVPLRPLFAWAVRLRAAPVDRERGDRLVVMDAGGLRVGPLVCFESAFPDLSRRLVAGGAQLLVYQSSTSTFQQSWAPEQHAALAALRATESGRPVVHATLTGVSAAYHAGGRAAVRTLGTDQAGTLVVGLPLAAGRTPYETVGETVPALAVAVTVSAGRRAGRPARVTVEATVHVT